MNPRNFSWLAATLLFSVSSAFAENVDPLATLSITTVNGKTTCESSDPLLCPRIQEEQKLESLTHKRCMKDVKQASLLVDICLSMLRKELKDQGKTFPEDHSRDPSVAQNRSELDKGTAAPSGASGTTSSSSKSARQAR